MAFGDFGSSYPSNAPGGSGMNLNTPYRRLGMNPNVGGADTVPAMLQPGEFVVNSQAAGHPDIAALLMAINQMGGGSQHMAGGGMVRGGGENNNTLGTIRQFLMDWLPSGVPAQPNGTTSAAFSPAAYNLRDDGSLPNPMIARSALDRSGLVFPGAQPSYPIEVIAPQHMAGGGYASFGNTIGSSYPSNAPGAAFHQWDAVSRRRFNVSGGQRPSWDIPSESGLSGGLAPTPATPAAPSAGLSSTAAIPDWIRNTAMADNSARIGAARTQAGVSAGGDPSLSAYGGLNALLSGQGEAARQANAGALGWSQHLADQAQQEAMLRLQYKLAEEQMRKQNQGAWIGDLAQLGGTLGGAFLGGPGGAVVANKLF